MADGGGREHHLRAPTGGLSGALEESICALLLRIPHASGLGEGPRALVELGLRFKPVLSSRGDSINSLYSLYSLYSKISVFVYISEFRFSRFEGINFVCYFIIFVVLLNNGRSNIIYLETI